MGPLNSILYVSVLQYLFRVLPKIPNFKLRSSGAFRFGITVTLSSLRSTIAGLWAGSIPPEIVQVPTYDEDELSEQIRSNRFSLPK